MKRDVLERLTAGGPARAAPALVTKPKLELMIFPVGCPNWAWL